MKVISLCLLVVASASFLLTTVSANAVESYENSFDLEWDMAALNAELSAVEDMDGEYMDLEAFNFLSGCKKVLLKGLKGVNGTNCIFKEFVSVMGACTTYIDNIGHCTLKVPADIQAIVDNAKEMISIGNTMIHVRSQLCAAKPTTPATRGVVSAAKNSLKCFGKLFYYGMSMVRHMNTMIKQTGRLPPNTATCFLSATHNVVAACNAFLPNVDTCISYMS